MTARFALLLLIAATGAAGEALIPWQWRQTQDANGSTWDMDNAGRLHNGTNSVVNQACYLLVNGNQINFQQQRMSADGLRFHYSTKLGDLTIERHLRIDAKTGAGRWVEAVINGGRSPATCQLALYSRLNYSWDAAVGDSGGAVDAAPGPKDFAVVLNADPNHGAQVPAIVLAYGDPQAKVRATVVLDRHNNQNIQTSWTLSVPPGGTVAVAHVLAQRPGKLDAKALAALVRGWRTRSFLADLPPALRNAIVNWGRGGGAGLAATRLIPADLIPQPGEAELLVIGGETRLRGSSSAEAIAIVSARGRVEVPYARVAALAGRDGRLSAFLRDGQVISGDCDATLRFTLASGQSTAVTPARVGWLVRCGLDKTAPLRLVDVSDGQVLAASGATRIPFATGWGVIELPLDQIRRLGPADDGSGMVAVLEDGTRLIGHVAGPVTIANEFFPQVELDATQIVGAGRIPGDNESDEPPAIAHLRLIGGQIVVGAPAERDLRVVTEAGELPVPVGQVRTLTNNRDAGEDGDGAVLAELWGGDVIAGRLATELLSVTVCSVALTLPCVDLVEMHVPTPTVSPETRERLVALVRDLGDEEWPRREAATKALADLGEMARAALEEAARSSADLEVRSRAEALIKALP
ncbi:MAG TPA: hypothetical protein VEL07_17130 [Planctomycetota bacterium]|nr:hypothetical protein [Planctomycetota bacterium]